MMPLLLYINNFKGGTMQKVKSLGELNTLIYSIKKRHPNCVSNYYLMKDIANLYIEEGRMLFDYSDDYLIVLLDEEDYYKLILWANEITHLNLSSFNKDLVCEILCHKTNTQKILPINKLLLKNNFYVYAENTQVLFNLEKLNYPFLCDEKMHSLLSRGYNWRKANAIDYSEVTYLWKCYIDKYAFDYNMKKRYSRFLEKEDIFVFTDTTGKICAVTSMLINGNTCEQRHTVVDPDFRGLGLGELSVLNAFRVYHQRGFNKCTTWIEKNNFKSIKMHLKFGVFTSKMCRQYLYSPEKNN